MTEIALDARPRVAGHFRLQWEEVQKSWVLLYPEGMVKLNGSAGEIMSRLDGHKTVADVVAELERAFDTQDLAQDVQDFLALAHKQGWVQT
ncbi:MAG: pyrroloquinoline quinone biosynthesis peptide chaperone PqqD [Hylemonella sp.]|nr:pyrroloquinoline quinone biosynthesis peptide chaperone PqqD [Hylemonella sp.]